MGNQEILSQTVATQDEGIPWSVLDALLVLLMTEAIISIARWLVAPFGLWLVSCVSGAASVALILLMVRRRGGKTTDLRFRALQRADMPVLGSGILVVVARFFALWALEAYPSYPEPETPLAIMIAAHGVVTPLAEEMTHRAFMLPAFTKRLGPTLGILLSTILFTFVHDQSIGTLISFLPLALTFDLQYQRTRNALVPTLTHAVANTLALVGSKLV